MKILFDFIINLLIYYFATKLPAFAKVDDIIFSLRKLMSTVALFRNDLFVPNLDVYIYGYDLEQDFAHVASSSNRKSLRSRD